MSDLFDAINQMHPRHRSNNQLFKPVEYKLVNDQVVKLLDVKVHEFNMGDVEDPDLYAAQPIYEWQKSEAGQWVMAHAVETPFWKRHVDYVSYGYQYAIFARLREQDQLYWTLKWGGNK
jgi:hypothetical protein